MIQQPLRLLDLAQNGRHMRRPAVMEQRVIAVLVDVGSAPDQMVHHGDPIAAAPHERAVQHQAVLQLGALGEQHVDDGGAGALRCGFEGSA